MSDLLHHDVLIRELTNVATKTLVVVGDYDNLLAKFILDNSKCFKEISIAGKQNNSVAEVCVTVLEN